MRLPNALRTAAFRLTAIYAALFALSLAAILAIIISLVDQSMRDQVRAAARDDALRLAQSYKSGHLVGESGAAFARKKASTFSFVRRRDGTQVVVEFYPPGTAAGYFDIADNRVQIPRDHEPDGRLLGFGILLPDGSYVAAARDDDPIHETGEAVVEAATTAAVVALTLALVVGLLMSALSLRRVEAFNKTARAIFRGKMDQRMPISGTGDEFDRLAINLNSMLDRISTLMDDLRQISTDVAHDLRTPLSRLRQRLEGFGRTQLTKSQRIELEAALDEADGILSIFAALMQIAQVEGARAVDRFADVELYSLLSEVGDVYQPVVEAADHFMTVSANGTAVVRGNRELLVQMLVNLVENAITHTPRGTNICVDLAGASDAPTVVISDDGPGIPANERERVFRRFYRLDRSRSTSGTGLGLSLVAAIADIHGVTISLSDNKPGLRVVLTFPSQSSNSKGSRSDNSSVGLSRPMFP